VRLFSSLGIADFVPRASIHRADPASLAAFRAYLKSIYVGDITRLNANWRTSFADFNHPDAAQLPADRDAPSFFVSQWRQQSIGRFIASGALTARTFDPNHL
jgi:hypothetical protein